STAMAAHLPGLLQTAGASAAAAYVFALLHGAGNGMLTIAKGTLPLALFGPAGYGQRVGWLNAPARILHAAAPLVFGAALTGWGLSAIWLTAGIGLAALIALMLLRRS
ncbi:MAG TPA: MFS transporter, partial [Paracoccus sp.]|nr:MFS transporter [Paracoccus sp. (in: a-proteobacteria)]